MLDEFGREVVHVVELDDILLTDRQLVHIVVMLVNDMIE